jgi:6,7-dimethyl-8-ribityllumazine synthase
MKIAIVVSRFNDELTSKLLDGAYSHLLELGLNDADIKTVAVPGAVEIPLLVQELAMQKKFDAIIALSAVVRGDTDHYVYVCQQLSYGCQKVALEQQIPVIFGVLTVDNWVQALDRLGGNHGHKGKEAADTAVATIQALRESRVEKK